MIPRPCLTDNDPEDALHCGYEPYEEARRQVMSDPKFIEAKAELEKAIKEQTPKVEIMSDKDFQTHVDALEKFISDTKLKEENAALKKEIEDLKKEKMDASRKYLPTLSELLDRLTITQIKEVKIPEHKDKYAQEIKEILHDIDLIISKNDIVFNGKMLRAFVVLAQMNLHIWHNESNFRRGIKDGNDLELTHGLNGIRNTAKNMIQDVIGGRKDYKIDCVAAEFKDWEVSW